MYITDNDPQLAHNPDWREAEVASLVVRLIRLLPAADDSEHAYPSRQEGPAMKRKGKLPFNPKSFLAKVGEGRSIGRYRKDQIVFSQGDPADAVFYIQKGKAKVTVVSEQGKEAVVAILGADEFFGEGCLAAQAQRMANVATMTDSVIMRLEKTAVVGVI